ncbi:MAG: c-type cytochrome [Planctomycetia bacterium]|nr:c-type cytochrome [Planctomycetia bacterium]
MPATEQTWRNLKSLHVVFGISAAAMLLISVWMLASDHNREAKGLQKQFGAIETKFLEWRSKEQLTSDYTKKKVDLEAEYSLARSSVPSRKDIDAFLAEANKRPENKYDTAAIEADYAKLLEAEQEAKAIAVAPKPTPETAADRKAFEEKLGAAMEKVADKRNVLLASMQRLIDKASFVENESQRQLKFTKADLDVDMSMLAIGVDEGKSPEELDKIQKKVDAARTGVEEKLTPTYQANKTHRLALFNQLTALKAREVDAKKELDKHNGDVERLNTAIKEKAPNLGRTFLEMPVVDAFGGPLKPAQVWLPDLTWNNNFRNVARFDRCVTCHQGIEKTAPGSAVDPAYETAHEEKVALETPKAGLDSADYAKPLNDRLQSIYGMQLSSAGLLTADDVTVEAVFPGGAAIRAGLKGGDVITRVGTVKILDQEMAENYLLKSVPEWGKPLELTIRRGLPHPYASHPRLDLFVGSMSPHKIGDFGCSICHEGQGNATAFKWASHTPNDPNQAAQWQREQGWFNNHHWIYPMLPTRFQEANCLKCHHDVTELKPSEKFPQPPAPKLIAGYETIENVGCFGCHEINGYDGPKKRRGPDLRAEPNYFAAAAQVLADPKLQVAPGPGSLSRIAALATRVMQNPDLTSERKLLAELIVADAKGGADGKTPPTLGPETYSVAGILGADDEMPGKYPKVGPSLRYVAAKNDLAFLNSWIKDPRNFRPSTKMPKFFGLYSHLTDVEKLNEKGEPVLDKSGHPVMEKSPGLVDAERFEPIEVLAVSRYLLDESQPFKYVDAPKTAADGKTIEAASAERGKQTFQTRGCLACHSHAEFPGIHQTQGPDLSGIGAKLTDERGAKWLYSWLKQPNLYHARTVMPNLLLDPITTSTTVAGAAAPTTSTTDPAADIAAFLLADKNRPSDKAPWKPEAVPSLNGKEKDIDDLLRLYLGGAFTKSDTEAYLKTGIPAERKSQIKGDERLLIVEAGEAWSNDKKLNYLGKKSIGRLGCAGCHDIPGFEDAKSIGTGLADWGRKEPSKLAFEQILAYLSEKDGGHGHGGHGAAPSGPPKDGLTAEQRLDKGFYMEALGHHQREGFIWQKLREPRSYDYKKTENKSYIDRLRMPQFNLDDAQRESIMTFVLGLVAEPPPAKYVYRPSPRQQAVLEGVSVLEKFNCAGCHTLQQERWEIEYKPGKITAPPLAAEYPFLIPHYTPDQIRKSKEVDRRGLGHAHIQGLPQPKEDEEEPTMYFKLWSPTLVDGQTWLSGGTDIAIDEKLNPPSADKRLPQRGGIFANYLHPVALALEKKANPNVKASDVWGFGPPPLMGEGKKVQPRWLHDFLLDPHLIRPSAILRMPKFHLTSAESEAIVNHFAALDNVEFPYEFDERTRTDYVAAKDAEYQKTVSGANGGGATDASTAGAADDKRLNDAFKLITDQGFCIKCHRVGDFAPLGALAAQAPNLAVVNARLRPEFLRDWIANPGRILPYTGMPVNFPYGQTVAQHLYKGTSEEQVNAVVDLLLNYDNVMKKKTSVAAMVKASTPPPGSPTTPGAATTPGTPTPTGATPTGTTPSTGPSTTPATPSTTPTPSTPSTPTTPTPTPSKPSTPVPSTPTPPGTGSTPSPGTSSPGTPSGSSPAPTPSTPSTPSPATPTPSTPTPPSSGIPGGSSSPKP